MTHGQTHRLQTMDGHALSTQALHEAAARWHASREADVVWVAPRGLSWRCAHNSPSSLKHQQCTGAMATANHVIGICVCECHS